MCNNSVTVRALIITVVMLNKLKQNIGKHWNKVNNKQKKSNSKKFYAKSETD